MVGGWSGPSTKSWKDKKDNNNEESNNSTLAKTSDQLLCLDTDTMEWFQPTFAGAGK